MNSKTSTKHQQNHKVTVSNRFIDFWLSLSMLELGYDFILDW
ncbi:hypothetical protein EFER_1025 [Escherichia fergusonii ATCC 35469]|uniref:Uncharacterized protein n=1 Tax=Escherichia fergusonii (strain ATCC 35469 / DSM 13698 / CCUG 18766 / IAM 14443 / JCM 21226 / LMG 7866 / NBRC 102419 / NCTC 12128 / CDC 0568-73) TaxID=585054 RepID=B7LN45_ESCF3|nr:hypothetical protein EFER_1025 [Escherichia fergusonii ATCC 35469]